MQFLKILFWCLLAFVVALFTYGNWNTVPIHLWSGLIADVNLPLLVVFTFAIGFIPCHLYNLAVRWRLRQRLATAERQLAETRVAASVPTPVVTDPGIEPAAPGIVTPGTVTPGTVTTTVAAPGEGRLL